MKFTTVFAVLATVATAVSATTNGERLRRGLSLNPPVRRGSTPTYSAPKNKPSGISNSCNTGPVQCCNSVTSASSAANHELLSLLGLVVPPDVAVGLTCSPIKAVLGGGTSCNQQPVCCENNKFNGLVAIGCSPININLV